MASQPFALALPVPGLGRISAGTVSTLTLAGAACVLTAPVLVIKLLLAHLLPER